MPARLEQKLKKEAASKGYSGERAKHYVFGTMNVMGMMHGNKETAKGRAYDRKHRSKPIMHGG